jgi:hypothetical protein
MDNNAENPPTEILEPAPADKPRNRRGRRIALVASAVLVGGAGVGAYAASSYLSGGGTQPDDVLRSGAVAFAKVDLDPAANQKIAAYQLSRRFPDLLKDNGKDQVLKETVLAGMFKDGGVSYEQDVKPWLGDRAGVAVYPAAKKGGTPQVALAVQYTDVDKMTAAMEKLDVTNDMGWTTDQGYVVVSDTTDAAKSALAAGGSKALAGQDGYRADVAALEGDQLAVAWVDYGSLADAEKAMAGAQGLSMMGLPGLAAPGAGRLAVGLHAASDYLELQGRTFGATGGASAGRVAGTNLAGQMPADSLGALSLTGLGTALADAWPALSGTPFAAPAIGNAEKQFGLKLPGDFKALFGDETGAAIGPMVMGATPPKVTVRTRGGDLPRAEQLMAMLTTAFGIAAPTTEKTDDGFVVGTDAATVKAAATGADRLGDSKSFKTAVPDAEHAGVVIYVNLDRAVKDGLAAGTDAAKLASLDAVGFTTTAEANPTLRLRLTFH